MARFYMDTQNSRGNAVTAMSHKGQNTHTRGWSAGIRVVSGNVDTDEGDRDVFYVYQTSGSRGGASDVLLGILDEVDGWQPAARPLPRPIPRSEGELVMVEAHVE